MKFQGKCGNKAGDGFIVHQERSIYYQVIEMTVVSHLMKHSTGMCLVTGDPVFMMGHQVMEI
jgi:hypothetical protein